MKDLTDDILMIKDRLGNQNLIYTIEFNFEKYDNTMEDFDKRITRYDEEYHRFLEEVEVIGKFYF